MASAGHLFNENQWLQAARASVEAGLQAAQHAAASSAAKLSQLQQQSSAQTRQAGTLKAEVGSLVDRYAAPPLCGCRVTCWSSCTKTDSKHACGMKPRG